MSTEPGSHGVDRPMRIVRPAETQLCDDCRDRGDVVSRGHRTWYSCWDHAPALLQDGRVLVGGDLASKRR